MNMRKTYLILLSFICFSFSMHAQNILPTSADEYQYSTVGYRLQLQAKLDMKQGYLLKEMPKIDHVVRKMEFKALFRKGEPRPCAIIMIYSLPRVAPVYYCLPTFDADQELWDMFYSSLESKEENPMDKLHFFSYCIAKAGMYLNTADWSKD